MICLSHGVTSSVTIVRQTAVAASFDLSRTTVRGNEPPCRRAAALEGRGVPSGPYRSDFLVLGLTDRAAPVLLRPVEEFDLPLEHVNRHSALTSDGRIPLTTPN
jgi:hypothetical protein